MKVTVNDPNAVWNVKNTQKNNTNYQILKKLAKKVLNKSEKVCIYIYTYSIIKLV